MLLIIVQLIFALILVLFIAFVYRSLTTWPRRGIPHIAPNFPFGNFTGVFAQSQSFADLIQSLYQEVTPSTRFVGIYAGLRPTLLIRDPHLANEILVSQFGHFHDRGLYVDERNDPLSANLVSLSGDRWRRLRAKLSPAFTAAKVRAMFDYMLIGGKSLEWKLNEGEQTTDNVLEMHEIVAQYTTNVIGSVAFGVHIDCIRDPETLFRVMGRKIFEPSVINGIRDAAGFLFPSLQRWLPFKSIDQEVEDFFVSMVRQNLKQRSEEGSSQADFFQSLLELWKQQPNGGLTDMECTAQAFIFYVAGFETSSTTMAFALFELARNQDCQLKVQHEIDKAIKANGGKLTYEAVESMKYLDSCIKETLRKYPPLPFLNRECSRDWLIPGTENTIPKGTPVIVPIHAIQNDPFFYPNPTHFDPERFADPNNICKRQYLPFGAGPRNCIGQKLGHVQTKVGLVMLLRGHTFQVAGNTALGNELKMCKQNVLLCSEGGVHLKVIKRN